MRDTLQLKNARNPREGSSATRGLLKESVAAQLREEILAGRIAPGEKIIEGRWARQFGVAQVSVREGLNILTTEGFVTKGHGRSARVLKLSESDIIHLYQVRGALEGLAARLITEQRLPVDDLEAAMAGMRQAVELNDVRRVVDCVQRFHVSFLEKPGNSFLRETGRRLVIPLYAFTLMRALSQGSGCQSVGIAASEPPADYRCDPDGKCRTWRSRW